MAFVSASWRAAAVSTLTPCKPQALATWAYSTPWFSSVPTKLSEYHRVVLRFSAPHWWLRKTTMVTAGHSFRPHAVSSFIEIPKAPSPAKPTTGTFGLPIFAPIMDGKPYPQGPYKPGAKYFRPLSKLG